MGTAKRDDETAMARLQTFRGKLAGLKRPHEVEVNASSGYSGLTGQQHGHKNFSRLPLYLALSAIGLTIYMLGYSNKDPLAFVLWILTQVGSHKVKLERNPYMYQLKPTVANWRGLLPLPAISYGKDLEDIIKERNPEKKRLDLYVLEDGEERVTVKPTPSIDEPKKPFGNIWERDGTIVLKGMVSLPSISYVYVYFRYLRSSAGSETHRL